jgi:ABC-type multidrug transport system ATPase subunit
MKILAENLEKKFRQEYVIKNFNFEFRDHQKYAIVGPNGSGKSTLLQLLSQFSLPTKGTVTYFDNQGIKIENDQSYKKFSFAAPYSEIIEEFSVSELISFLVSIQNLPSEFNINTFEEFSELKTNPNKLIKDFSSGMKQKTKLTLAFSAPRPFLFLDEPTTNLDSKSKDWFQRKLDAEKDKLIVIASNEESEIKFCEERIQILDFK